MSFRHEFEHRDALRTAAVDAFVTRGYDGASLSAILAASGMSKGQFYHHFDGKQGLYLAVCEAMIDRKRAHFAAHPPSPTTDPFDMVAASLEAGLAFAAANPDLEAFGKAFLSERGRPIFDVVMRTFPLAGDAALFDAVARGVANGAFAEGFTPGFVARAFGVVIAASGDLIDGDDPSRGVGEIVAFLRRGLAAG